METNDRHAAVRREKEAVVSGTREPGKTRAKRRAWPRRMRRALIVLALLTAALFALRAYLHGRTAQQESERTLSRATVLRGAISETVYGTGTTLARSQPNLLAGASGTLAGLRVSVGDTVKAGDVLAVLVNEELDDTITNLEFQLWDLDDTIAGTASDTVERTIQAPVAGRVVAVYAQEGDDALAVFRREGALAVISTDGRMRVELEELAEPGSAVLGERVNVEGVTGEGEAFSAQGTVTDVTRQGTRASVTVLDDTLPMGARVRVTDEQGEVLGEGTLQVNKPMAVSSYGGTVAAVRVRVGDRVARGSALFRLEDSPLTLAIENLRLQREAAAKELTDAKEQRENLIVLAPCDGVVATLNVAEGDEVEKGMLLGSILEGEEMNLSIAVDELDVVKVEPGQSVVVTVDALSGAALPGTVAKIAPVGSGSGGVTSYSVELTIDAAGSGVRPGMNATGEITVASEEDALYVPVEALVTLGGQTYLMVESSAAVSPAASVSGARLRGGLDAPGTQAEGNGALESGNTEARGGTRDAVADADTGTGQPAANAASPNAPGAAQGAPAGADGTESPGAYAETRSESAAQRGANATGAQDSASRRARQSAQTVGDGQQQNGGLRAQAAQLLARFAAWMTGTDGEAQPEGALVPVTTGIQNDDYIQITSGVSEGDVVLFEGGAQGDSAYSMGGMSMTFGGMGALSGMMGGSSRPGGGR